jgi:hypothetical protein
MNRIAGVNALFFGVWTGNSCAIAAAPPKIANVIHPSVSRDSWPAAGRSSPAPTARTIARYARAGRGSSGFVAAVLIRN